MKTTIEFDGPILPGSISMTKSRCGKLQCACKAKPPKLHGPYYRWTGMYGKKRTTITIDEHVARESKLRIKRYRAIQKQMESILKKALIDAPWNQDKKRKST
jgi:hypothetical protein